MNLLRRPKQNVKPWDETFERWIRTGAKEGVDPNDIGDREWGDPRAHLRQFYFPHMRRESTVLELGPGSGRITRHLIGECRHMQLVDYSAAACEWLNSYLAGKGQFETHAIKEPAWPGIASESVHFACAFGVFEHIDLDDMRWYVEEMYRVLKPGGAAVFNFDNFMSSEGIEWHKRWRGNPGHRNIFRFYHPDMVRLLAEVSGFQVIEVRTSETRHAEIELRKP